MDANMVLALGLGMRPPWRLVGHQRLVPGRQGTCSRISQRHNLRDHDLHDRRPWETSFNPLETSKNRTKVPRTDLPPSGARLR